MPEPTRLSITQNGEEIGFLVWEMTDEAAFTGEIAELSIPTRPTLEAEILRHLDENPNVVHIEGGLAEDELWRYPEGVVNVLLAMMDEHDFGLEGLDEMPSFGHPEQRVS